ncbi:MAG: aryl-sulfate sulfotransferase [Pseudomonadales bacterium]
MAWLTHRPVGLTYKSEASFPGYTIFSSVRGHHATIIDAQGRVVHQWHHDEGIQHLKMLKNGNLLIQTLPPEDAGGAEKIGGSAGALIELDWNSNTVWEHRDVMMHHDYQRLPDGNTLYLGWEVMPKAVCEQIKGGHHHEDDPGQMWGDVVKEIRPDGTLVSVWKSWQHLSFDEDCICPLESHKEWTHSNSLEILENGDWLISFRLTDTIGIVDKDTGEIKWKWGPGQLSHQHNAQQLASGNILIFDNGCHRKRGPSFSRVLEIDPESREIVWSYFNPTMLAFFSFMVSGCQRLPNGNTLITEGASGRLFEVTEHHEVVWEYISPWTIPSGFGPTPAVFRSYRIGMDDPFIRGKSLSPQNYAGLNRAIENGEVQREHDYDHRIPVLHKPD